MRRTTAHLLRLLAAGAMLILLMAAQSPVALAKSWSISKVVIDAALQPDGSLVITEHRTFQFSGAFSHIYQEIVVPNRSVIGEISLADETGPLREATGKQAGTFTVSTDGGNVLVDWYFQAADTEKTFTLSYRLTDAVRLYRDRAELDWDFIGARWESGTAQAEVRLSLPMEPARAQIVEPHGTLSVTGSQVQVNARSLSAGQRLRVRLDLPRTAFPNAPIAPEAGLFDVALQAGWIAIATVLGIRFFYAHVLRQRPDPKQVGQPQPLPPLLVARLTQQDLSTGLRTLLSDLSARGLVTVEPIVDKDWQFRRSTGQDGLEPCEAKALGLFFGPGESEITLSEWQRRMEKNQEAYRALKGWWSELKGQLPGGWFVPWRWDLFLVLAALVPVLFMTTFSPVSGAAIGLAAVLLILALSQRRYTDEGYHELAAWRAERFRLMRSVEPAEFSLGVALGLKLMDKSGPGLALRQEHSWLWDTGSAFDTTFASFSDGGGGGDGGGDGGGGGGAE